MGAAEVRLRPRRGCRSTSGAVSLPGARSAGNPGGQRALVLSFVLLSSWWIAALAAAEPPVAPAPAGSGGAKPLGSERSAQVVAKVLPKEGYTLPIKWGDLGVKLVQLGVIDLEKFKKLYGENKPSELQRLEKPSEAFITITSENQRFLVTVLWGLGLANKNPLLDKALAERGTERMMSLASTGGWTLGTKPAVELYGKLDIIRLTPEQQELVAELAQSIYRPCCNNSTAFPDCNHGAALLGLIELMAANGFSREDIWKASLRFNAFWFPQYYVKTALLFELRGVDWEAVDPREVLGLRYSSLSGWRQSVDAELKKVAQLVPLATGAAACAIPAPAGAAAAGTQPASTSPRAHHVHGLALDRAEPEVLYIATHTGLVRVQPNAAPEWVGGQRFDLMGFTASDGGQRGLRKRPS